MLGTLTVIILFTGTLADHEPRFVHRGNRWPRGEVPYRFSYNIDESSVWATTIREAILEVDEIVNGHVIAGTEPCLRFWHSSDSESVTSYLYFHVGDDGVCGTASGMTKGRHFVFLDADCQHKSGVMMMLLLALGLNYEHRRPDRDNYVTVEINNVRDGYKSMYQKLSPADDELFGIPYDFESLTHFSPYQNANNSLSPTMTSTVSSSSLGNKDRMSVSDVKKLQIAYDCANDTTALLHKYSDVVSCSFQKSSCELTYYVRYDSYNHQFQNQWQRRVGALPHNGPTGDNSNGRGTYQYTTHSDAWLRTNYNLPAGTYCIHLHYCIATTRNTTPTRVQLRTHTNSVFAEGHYVSKAWTPLNITHVETSRWQLWIGSVIGSSGDALAVDDVFVTSSACPSL